MHHWFEDRFGRLSGWYRDRAQTVVARRKRFGLIYLAVVALLALLFIRLPTGFIPSEDQGYAALQFNLPAGATLEQTREAALKIEQYVLKQPDVAQAMVIGGGGGGGGGGGQNSGRGFIALKDWSIRKGSEHSADAVTRKLTQAMGPLRDVEFYATVPSAVRGLGQSSGFSAELLNTGSLSQAEFAETRDAILAEARADSSLGNVRLSSLPDQPTLKVDTEPQRLAVLGLSQADVNTTLSAAWGGRYVNDFVDKGRVKRVYVQGDAQYRSAPEDIGQWYVRGSTGAMVPFSAIAQNGWSSAPSSLSRFSGIRNESLSGQASPGTSSGTAMDSIQTIIESHPGVSVAWSGASYQERLSSGQAPYLYAISLLVVFLCLAALYESWSIPLAVLLVIPLGLVGAIVAVTLRGLENDVFLQIGLLTTMGLAAKNAILMIEFAEQAEKAGRTPYEAALDAARIRLRPILMTSCAFIFGVMPLALASGAGANSRIAIGTAVIGGMLTATLLAIFYIPFFFVLVRTTTRDSFRKLFRRRNRGAEPQPEPAE